MPNYRRNLVEGGTYFFTVVLANRSSDLLTREIDTLRQAVRIVRCANPFHIHAWTVLPDHLHCVWTLPDGDADFPTRWRGIKAAFSASLPATRATGPKGYRGIWQRGYWEHTIRNDRDFAAHIDYTLFNPVKHGLAETPADWPYSSFKQAVAAGLYPANWSKPTTAPPKHTGE